MDVPKSEIEQILEVIASGIDLTRKNPKPNETIPSDDYTAWVIWNELRRAVWKIVRAPA